MASITPIGIRQVSGAQGLDELLKDIDQLVSLPDIYYRLESAIADPSSSSDSIASLLETDPDLSARLLRLANSAFYSFPTSIETIERAVNVIGLRQIREMILITAVVQAFNGIPAEMVNMSMFWQHSIAVGIMSRELAMSAGIAKSENYYIPGLLHDIGRLVLYLKLPVLMHELMTECETKVESLYKLEQQHLGYTHADVGGTLLKNWKLPESIYQPIAEHHQIDTHGEFAQISCAIHIADSWVNANQIGSSGEMYATYIDPEAISLLHIDPQELDEIGVDARELTQSLLRLFVSH